MVLGRDGLLGLAISVSRALLFVADGASAIIASFNAVTFVGAVAHAIGGNGSVCCGFFLLLLQHEDVGIRNGKGSCTQESERTNESGDDFVHNCVSSCVCERADKR